MWVRIWVGSSVGRTTVSKTVCRRFDSYPICHLTQGNALCFIVFIFIYKRSIKKNTIHNGVGVSLVTQWVNRKEATSTSREKVKTPTYNTRFKKDWINVQSIFLVIYIVLVITFYSEYTINVLTPFALSSS